MLLDPAARLGDDDVYLTQLGPAGSVLVSAARRIQFCWHDSLRMARVAPIPPAAPAFSALPIESKRSAGQWRS